MRPSSGELPLIAEDLGVITEPVERLRDELGLPGMVVLQFAFDPATRTARTGPRTTASDVVAYTGTHDNDTLRGLVGRARGAARARRPSARSRAAGVAGDDPALGADPAGVLARPRADRDARRPRTCSGSAARRA